MIGVRVNSVGSNRIDTKLLKDRNITLANFFIGERVDILVAAARVTTGPSAGLLLVRYTLYEELLSALCEEFGALGSVSCLSWKFGRSL